MTQTPANDYVFFLSRSSYRHTRLLAWLLIAASLVTALASPILAARLWPMYSHTFTPYLKWQDALFASLLYIALILLGGGLIVVRFLYALRSGYHQGMFVLEGRSALTVRDVSPKSLSRLYWAVGTPISFFISTLIGPVPSTPLPCTFHLPH